MIALKSIMGEANAKSMAFDMFTKEVYVSLAVSLVTFIAGYYVISRRSVK
jgi:hypothetical protein